MRTDSTLKKTKKTGCIRVPNVDLSVVVAVVVVVVPSSSLDHLPLALPRQHALLPGRLRSLREFRLRGRGVRSRRSRLDSDSGSDSRADFPASASTSSAAERTDAAA